MKSITTSYALLLVAALCLAGCASAPLEGASQTPAGDISPDQFGSMLFPTGAKINLPQSLMMGTGDNWVGRVVMDLGQNHATAYRFFQDQYPQQGWSLVSAVRGKASLLVFMKADRSATVEISDGSVFGGSSATLTVTPKNAMAAPVNKL